MALDFKEVKADQDYKANQSASICHNCLHMEKIHDEKIVSRPVFRFKCGIGRFYVEKIGVCRLFEQR